MKVSERRHGGQVAFASCVIGAVLACLSCRAVAQAAENGVPDVLRACTQERDDSRRLACYDREMKSLAGTPGNTPDKSIGLSEQQERKLEPSAARDKPASQVISTVVSAVHARADGRLVFALANGQTWVQGDAWETFQVKVGDAVTIKPGLLGSFHLYAPSGLAIRVTRAR